LDSRKIILVEDNSDDVFMTKRMFEKSKICGFLSGTRLPALGLPLISIDFDPIPMFRRGYSTRQLIKWMKSLILQIVTIL
jgi:hypothetical protein